MSFFSRPGFEEKQEADLRLADLHLFWANSGS